MKSIISAFLIPKLVLECVRKLSVELIQVVNTDFLSSRSCGRFCQECRLGVWTFQHKLIEFNKEKKSKEFSVSYYIYIYSPLSVGYVSDRGIQSFNQFLSVLIWVRILLVTLIVSWMSDEGHCVNPMVFSLDKL